MTTNYASWSPGIVINTEAELFRLEDIVANMYNFRNDVLGRMMQGRDKSNIDEECGYPAYITPQQYRTMFDRNPLGNRVCNVWAKESWQVTPTVFEDRDSKRATKFEAKWDKLSQRFAHNGKSWYKDEKGANLWSYLLRADILSGIGSFGLLFLGFNDGKELHEPVAGVMPDGNAMNVPQGSSREVKDIYGTQTQLYSMLGTDALYYQKLFPSGTNGKRKGNSEPDVIFLRVYDESLVEVVQYEANMNSPRFGLPVMYRITINDPRMQHSGIGLPINTLQVHWSRVIHIADNLTTSEPFGQPRQYAVWNTLLDTRKLYGGSAEMYWQGALPGLSIETHPQLGGEVEINKDNIRQMMYDYKTRLQRFLVTSGMNVKSLAPQVSSPKEQIETAIEAICIQIEMPVRIFKGSERGELASSQDDGAWNDRLRLRQNNHNTPKIIVPFVDRLIETKVLPEPDGFSCEWPDLESQTEGDKAKVFLTRVQGYAAAAQGNVEAYFTPLDIMTKLDGMDEEDAKTVLENVAGLREGDTDGMPETQSPLLGLVGGITGMIELFKLAKEGGLSEEQLKQQIMLFFKVSEEKAEEIIADGLTPAAQEMGEGMQAETDAEIDKQSQMIDEGLQVDPVQAHDDEMAVKEKAANKPGKNGKGNLAFMK